MTTIHEALLDAGIRPFRPGTFWQPGDHKTRCPKCSDTRKKRDEPCLAVTISHEGGDTKAVWYCHHCSWPGWAGTGRLAKIRRAEKVFARPGIKPVPPQQALIDWFASRGIPEHIVRAEKCFAATAWFRELDGKAPCVAFPFFKQGELVNVKYREPKQKLFAQERGAEPVPYRLDSIRGAKAIWITEGEMDALTLLVVGETAVISVPDGATKPAKGRDHLPTDSAKFAWFEAAHPDIEAAERVYLAVDADEPGQALARELIRRVGREKCWVVDWPEGINDANAMLLKHGEEALRQCLDQARPVPAEGEVTVGSLWDKIEALHAGGAVEWYGTGFAGMDPVYRVLR
jgi:twinkle protein